MIIKDSAWRKYINGLRKISDKAASEMSRYLATTAWYTNNVTRQAAIDYAYALATKYGEGATALACEMYDAVVAATAKRMIQPASPAATATYSEVASAINGTAKTGNTEIMSSSIGRLVKQAGVDTTMQNAIRDGAEWAWIPVGETCAFCLTLASNGWQRASKKALNGDHAEHIHQNCDCTYAIRFDSSTNVQGYNPDKYKRMYYNAEGSTPETKINSMRRDFYAANSEEINAQKRDNYEKRKEREASDAEEMDVN